MFYQNKAPDLVYYNELKDFGSVRVCCTIPGGENEGPVEQRAASSGTLDDNHAPTNNDELVASNFEQDEGSSSGQEGMTSN